MNIHDMRLDYRLKKLSKNSLNQDPFTQFKDWLEEAVRSQLIEPNAMSLATTTKSGKPSCRTVLLKGFDTRGFMFYTNLESRKASELNENPQASAIFWWRDLERQVLLEGPVETVSQEESCLYFARRPRASQISAWASHQDAVISSRQLLEEQYRQMDERFRDQSVPKPPFWGGFRLVPERFEFWQGRADRLHDRFQYVLEHGVWKIDRLSP